MMKYVYFMLILFVNIITSNEIKSKKDEQFLVVGGYLPPDISHLGKYMVSIRTKNLDHPFGKGHKCGGTILTPTAVLTAAHCLINRFGVRKVSKRQLIIVAGTFERLVKGENTRTYAVEKVVVHEKYRGYKNLNYDVGVLRTTRKISIIPGVSEIVPLQEKFLKPGTRCTVVGWGRLWTAGPIPNELFHAQLETVNKWECKSVLPLFNPQMMMCAESPISSDQDSCQGDSGGPLFCGSSDAQSGIVSFGMGCGLGLPAAYTDVASLLTWIKENKSYHFNPNIMLFLLPLFNLMLVNRN